MAFCSRKLNRRGRVRHGIRCRLCAACSALVLASAAVGQSGGLFAPLGPERTGAASAVGAVVADQITLRHRLATIDFGMLERVHATARPGSPPPALRLNLFDDASYEVIVDTVEPTFSGGYAISGRIAGEPTGSATLVVNGPTVAGSVRTIAGTWRISSVGGGRYAIGEIDPARAEGSCEVVAAPGVGLRNEPSGRQ